jgi:ABC-2 type transport system ATP-binding protein
MEGPVIEITDLTKKYGSFTAVGNLSLSVDKGEIFGLLGPNGAGKSTTILMMLGLTEPTSGTLRVCGINPTTNPVEVKRKVGYLPEDVGFYEDYTGFENLMYTARLNSIPEREARERVMHLLERVGLSGEESKKAGKYSRCMRQRLGLADVLVKEPEDIILDEPTLGIDPRGVNEFLSLIERLSREEKNTVLLSSHHLHQIQTVCDRVGIFVGGRLIAVGDIDSLSRKLFSHEPLAIEAGVSLPDDPVKAAETKARIKQKLGDIDGIVSVEVNGNIFRSACSGDVSGDIARVILDSGSVLTSLSGKEYGLDDIYNRYFEGYEKQR